MSGYDKALRDEMARYPDDSATCTHHQRVAIGYRNWRTLLLTYAKPVVSFLAE